MSEIKGQLLGMLLVLMTFGAIAGVLYGTFSSTSERIAETVDQEINLSAG